MENNTRNLDENITITNCNPRVYNIGNGGIVGIGGNSSDTTDMKLTFTNITAHCPKLIFAIIKYPMKIIFMKPRKAALSIVAKLFSK